MGAKSLEWGIRLTILGLLMAALTIWLGFTWAPPVNPDGWAAPEAYRILFWHVPTAWGSFLAFTLLFVGSVAWFWKRLEWGWKLHVVGAHLGLVYGLCVVLSGPIWGTAEWGVPWDITDMRLNTYAMLAALSVFLVLGHESQGDSEESRDLFSTVGLFGFALVPITIVAIKFWTKRHPPPILTGSEGPSLSPEILYVLLFGMISFQILVVGHAMLVWNVNELEQRLGKVQMELDQR